MKRIIYLQSIIFILFFIVLWRNFWVEEIILLYFLPLVISIIVFSILALIVRLFKNRRYNDFLLKSFFIASILHVFLLGFLLWSLHSRDFSKEQIIADIDYAKTLMEDVHPNLYKAIEKNKMEFIIDSVKKTIPENLSEVETYIVLNSIYSNIKDAHTKVTLNNYLKRGAVFFRKVPPYRFRIKDGKIFVLKNYGKHKNIPIGSEIIKINGKSSSECLDEINKIVSYETLQNLDAMLQLPILWGLWNNFNDFDITYKTPDNKEQSINTKSGLIANISFLWDFTGFFLKNYTFKILDPDIAIIDIKAFNDINKFKNFLEYSFSEMKTKNIDNLIIDIRRNSGGNTNVSEELMQYISNVNFRSFDTSLVKISNELIRAYSLDTSKYKPGTFVLESNEMIPLRENPLRFKGNIYVLTSGYTFSTALDFVAMIRCYNIGKIVGTETGGKTVSYGSPHNFTLSNTGVEMKVSCKRFVNACGLDNNRGIIPDYIIENTIDDDIKGKDNALEYAMSNICKEDKNSRKIKDL